LKPHQDTQSDDDGRQDKFKRADRATALGHAADYNSVGQVGNLSHIDVIIAPMITKRQLGFAFISIGLLILGGVLAANLIGARDAGFGPLQKIGMGLGVLIILMSIPLIRLGNKPA
jgi:hypothetical protein